VVLVTSIFNFVLFYLAIYGMIQLRRPITYLPSLLCR